MAEPKLPVTREEEYWMAILEELRAIRKAIEQRDSPQPDNRAEVAGPHEVVLREIADKGKHKRG